MVTASESARALPSLQAGLDLPALIGWLRPQMADLDPNVQAERIDGGQSNPSWRLRGAHQSWVLRAKPGPAASLLPSAHAIEREYRILSALQGSDVPVPRVRVLCEDESVIGAAFYVMDHVEGRILRDATLPEIPKAERDACFAEAARVLAALHRVDWREKGLKDVLLFGGGIIPDQDIRALKESGVGALFTPGASTLDIVAYLKEWASNHPRN